MSTTLYILLVHTLLPFLLVKETDRIDDLRYRNLLIGTLGALVYFVVYSMEKGYL